MEADEVAIDVATIEEIPAVRRLLSECGLSPDGASHPTGTLLVGRAGTRVVGTVELEAYGDAGLLRGLAVAPDFRGRNLGGRLCRAALERASGQGVGRVFLLTVDAARFFAQLGFEPCERASVPSDLAASPQFTGAVCASATCMVIEPKAARALQDQYPGNHCFGCGPANERGLRLKSHWSGSACVAHFRPSAEHNAGPRRWLNGGIAATLVDCHSIFAAIANAYAREGRRFAAPPLLWYVTGSLSVRYERPAPIDADLLLSARIVSAAGRKSTVECTLSADGQVCVRSEVVAVRVPESWRTPPDGAGGR